MRKDVKFGLTVGGILLATLVVYIIVLTRGSGTPSHPDLVINGPDATASGASASPDDSSSSSTGAATDHSGVADGSSSSANSSGNTSSGSSNLSSPPATQPSSGSADASTSKNDWDFALSNGSVKLLAAGTPERTQTPSMDRYASSDATSIRPDVRPPLIDPPATQPSVADSADSSADAPPALDAAADPMPTRVTDTVSRPQANTTPDATALTARTHKVVAGENLWSISMSVYGSSKYVSRIVAANPGVDARHLKIGLSLVIPALSSAERGSQRSQTAGDQSSAAPAHDSANTYTVQAGDSLEKIAIKLYGDPKMIEDIYQLNKGLIGNDENRLKIGWTLKLPRPAAAH